MMIRTSYKAAAWALLAATSISASPSRAEELQLSADPMMQARAAEARRDPAEALARYLRVLSTRPRDLDALTGAGRAALEIGDPSAAIGFYARAEEIAPRNGRIKAGLGSAMLQMENAKAALRLFEEAVDRGVPAGDVASDRGLAYDMRGDNKRAQQEYALALRTRDDPETSRRLALSLAMTGDRASAVAALDPLLRRQDIPAWRARAFVLALTGDAEGAEKAALAVMPGPQAAALLPFLARLPMLKPQQQAAAVHFGHFPADGRRYKEGELFADASPMQKPALPGADQGLIPAGSPLGRSDGTKGVAASSERVSNATRRRPGSSEDRLASVMAAVLPKPAPSIAEPSKLEAASSAGAVAVTARDPFIGLPGPAALPSQSTPKVEPGFASLPEGRPPVRLAQAEPKATAAKPAEPVAPAKLTLPPKKPLPTPIKGAKSADSVKAKAKDAPPTKDAKHKDVAKGDSTKSKEGAADKNKDGKSTEVAKDKDSDKTKNAQAKASERHWVQVAGGANKGDLPKAFARLKEKSPKLFAGRSAWTTPLRATNRLLVGPFKTLKEAQEFVNLAGKDSLSAFAYTSPAGQDVEKLGAK